ncbi:MAG: type I restriction enzyme HsdR N-terminal domain-containing protein [Burkholderiaceae bacterium]|jgi:predicted type IV restriction endonuclease|nr:type I restriction enzyme HsdR N-terminal domain-containing protein [Rhodoferax sp.]
MFKIPKKVQERFADKIRQFQKIAEQQKAKDVSEADTVTVVKDILAEVFGYDKYQELTSELQIKGTFCDLAVKIDGKIRLLIEVKAAGVTLNSSHLRQAVAYGVTQGIEWVALTNGINWQVYRIKFGQPPIEEELTRFDFLAINPKNEDDMQKIFLLCKEGMTSEALDTFHQVAQLFNKHTVSVFLQSEAVLNALRREMKRIFPELKIDNTGLADLLVNEIIKRDAIDGEKYKEAETRVKKILKKLTPTPAKTREVVAPSNTDSSAEINS